MALSRSAMLMTSAGALAVVSVAAIGYRVWRDFYAPEPLVSSAQHAESRQQSAARARAAAPLVLPGRSSASQAPFGALAPVAAPSLPAFDVVRVEPSGDAVVAGRAAPHAKVTLLDNGTPLDQAETDASGQFAMTPPTLAKGSHELSLKMATSGRDGHSAQSVTVVVPKNSSGRLVVALVAPGQATRVLADEPAAGLGARGGAAASKAGAAPSSSAPGRRGEPPAAAQGKKPGPQVYIQTVEVGQDGGFYATGTAPAGALLRLYLNNSPVATVTADAAGHWSLKVEKGLRPGSYAVRADELDRANGTVLSRAEAPFEFAGFVNAAGRKAAAASAAPGKAVATAPVPSNPAAGEAAAPPPIPSNAAAGEANATVANLPTVQVVRGDNLWRISRRIFGRGVRYTLIYEANANQIRDRNLIYPGQIFVVPRS